MKSTGRLPRDATYVVASITPLDYVPGKKYPLVIQTHGFLPDKFGIDGAYVAPFAAPTTCGEGIMVLQADQDYGKGDQTPAEVDREVDRIESAIDYLTTRPD